MKISHSHYMKEAIKEVKKAIEKREKDIEDNLRDIQDHKDRYAERLEEMREEHIESFYEININACKKIDTRKEWIQETHLDTFRRNKQAIKDEIAERDAIIDDLKDENDRLALEIEDLKEYLAMFEEKEAK